MEKEKLIEEIKQIVNIEDKQKMIVKDIYFLSVKLFTIKKYSEVKK